MYIIQNIVEIYRKMYFKLIEFMISENKIHVEKIINKTPVFRIHYAHTTHTGIEIYCKNEKLIVLVFFNELFTSK